MYFEFSVFEITRVKCISKSKSPHTVFLRLLDGVFSFQNYPKNLDPSNKTDLDLWDCLGRVKLILQQNCMCSHSRNDVPPVPQRNVSIAAERGSKIA